jgi:uncharacterized membrane protein YgcG
MMRSKSIVRGLLFILVICLSIVFNVSVIQAQSSHPFYWEKITVDLKLVKSGDLLVTETQTYVFTDRYTNQRIRYIQIDRLDEVKDISVTEDNKPVSNLQISKEDRKQYIRWQHTLTNKFPETHTFVLKYRVVGGLEIGSTQTKFKWMAIFPDRQATIKAAEITLNLPDKLSELTKNFTTNGVATESKILDPNTIKFTAKGTIEPQSKLAILGEFPSNLLSLNKSQWQSSSNLLWWWWIPLLIIGLISGQGSSSAKSSSGGGGDGGDGGGCGSCGGCGGGD